MREKRKSPPFWGLFLLPIFSFEKNLLPFEAGEHDEYEHEEHCFELCTISSILHWCDNWGNVNKMKQVRTQNVDVQKQDKYVKRPIYCPQHRRMMPHTICFCGVEKQGFVVYSCYCHQCLHEEWQRQQEEFEKHCRRNFTDKDFVFRATFYEIPDCDWRHLWAGDYYDRFEWGFDTD